jgi:hypothetical protein
LREPAHDWPVHTEPAALLDRWNLAEHTVQSRCTPIADGKSIAAHLHVDRSPALSAEMGPSTDTAMSSGLPIPPPDSPFDAQYGDQGRVRLTWRVLFYWPAELVNFATWVVAGIVIA